MKNLAIALMLASLAMPATFAAGQATKTKPDTQMGQAPATTTSGTHSSKHAKTKSKSTKDSSKTSHKHDGNSKPQN